jgi:hypothetical protein
VVGVATTPSGQGYWLVTKDGGVFAEGDAGFFGSLVGSPSALPAIGLVATSGGTGYSVIESNGTPKAFGS